MPRDRLGVQQFSIRDSITRLDQSVTGYLGGPNFPQDAADIGPAGRPAGRLRARCSSTSRPSATTASSSSRSTRARTARSPTQEIRTALHNAGLKAAGTHTGGLQAMVVPANLQAQIDLAGILGYRMVGTAGNPANPTLGTLDAWKRYAEQANTVGAAFRAAGIKYFFHPEQDWFRFFADPAHPELDRVHRIDWFTDNTDPKLVSFEPDTMHTLAGRGRFPDPSTGGCSTSTPGTGGSPPRTGSSPGTPRTPTASSRCPRRARTRSPRRARGRGSRSTAASTSSTSARARSRSGYPVDPDPEVIGYQEQFDRFELSSPGWFHAESDSGPGPAPSTPAARCAGPRSARSTCSTCARTTSATTATTTITTTHGHGALDGVAAPAARGRDRHDHGRGQRIGARRSREPLPGDRRAVPVVRAAAVGGSPAAAAGTARCGRATRLPDQGRARRRRRGPGRRLGMLRTPQRYAETVATMIEHRLKAPVLMVTPYGMGVAGGPPSTGGCGRLPAAMPGARSAASASRAQADGDELARHSNGGRPADRPGRRSPAAGQRASGEAVHPSAGRIAAPRRRKRRPTPAVAATVC